MSWNWFVQGCSFPMFEIESAQTTLVITALNIDMNLHYIEVQIQLDLFTN